MTSISRDKTEAICPVNMKIYENFQKNLDRIKCKNKFFAIINWTDLK